MLKVTFEIIPHGDHTHKRRCEIGSLEIGLDAISNNIGTYTSTMYTDGHHKPAARVVHIDRYDRSHGAFLLAASLLNHHLYPVESVLGPSEACKRRGDLGDLLALQNAPGDKETPLSDSLVDIDPEARAELSTLWEAARNKAANLAVNRALRPKCAACGNQEDLTAKEYSYDHPLHYDGVSEYHCKCGARTGRWSNRILQPGEVERPFGY